MHMYMHIHMHMQVGGEYYFVASRSVTVAPLTFAPLEVAPPTDEGEPLNGVRLPTPTTPKVRRAIPQLRLGH